MGEVFEAFDRDHNARVALKVLATMPPEALLRFKNEFRALRDLEHPNVVSFGELVENAGRWFFTMEYVEGVNFLRYVRPDDSGRVESTTLKRPVPVAVRPDSEPRLMA